jgi:2,5-furandicarboxylate decarboxylase 1
MGFREFLDSRKREGGLITVTRPVSKRLEASGILKQLDGRPVLLEKIRESEFPVACNIFPSKELIAKYLEVEPEKLIGRIIHAIENPSAPERIDKAPCQEKVMEEVDLDRLPILFHCEKDGGNYISSGIVVAADPEYGQNLDFHRMMQIGKDRLSVRVVSGRHFDRFLQKNGKMPVAVCIGNGANVLLAAATSVDLGRNELEIANTLAPLQVVRASTFDADIPADCEFVLEGTIDLEDRADEGPFVDLTETYDDIRQEPVFTVRKITSRRDPVWQALLPGASEHKMLMGMPREPTIFQEVSKAGVACLDVNINPGGCSWLHAIVKIRKVREDDGKKALEAAFRGHGSMKHCFVVDSDIDIYNPLSVEWAMATRFQGDRGLFIRGREPGSSLDPSRDPDRKTTYKMGFDLTGPLEGQSSNFEKAIFPEVSLKKYLPDWEA